MFPETKNHKIFETNSCEVFISNIAQLEKLISVFQDISASINKTFILTGWSDIRLSYYEV